MLKDNKDLSRYFIAIVPEGKAFEEALAIKEYMANHFLSKAALRSPPHVTLHMPFLYKEKNEDQLINKLSVLGKEKPVRSSLSGFGAFPPKVIYIRVELNDDLYDLWGAVVDVARRDLGVDNATYRSMGFIPHMTVAFRDLKREIFYKAWEEFSEKPFEHPLQVDSISLLKHDGKQWNVLFRVPLEGK